MTGRYRKGRPYVVATVVLPRLNVCGDVWFMMDTGSDLSLLSPTDALRLGYPQEGVPISKVIGWEGRMEVGLEQALLAFDDIAIKIYSINLGIIAADPVPRYPKPSILGWDMMSRCRVVMEPREEVLEIEPKHADLDDGNSDALAKAIRLYEQSRNGSGHL